MPKPRGNLFPQLELEERIGFQSGNVFPANTTGYAMCKDQMGWYDGFDSASETHPLYSFLVTRGGLLRNLIVHTSAAPGGGEDFTYTVRINRNPTAMTCTIAVAAIAGSDLVNTAEVIAGDRVTVQIVSSAGATTVLHVIAFAKVTPMTKWGFEQNNFNSGDVDIGAGVTAYLVFSHRSWYRGGIVGSEDWPTVLVPITRKGSIRNLVVLAELAPGVGETVDYTVRVNKAASLVTVQLGGAVQYTDIDDTNEVQVDVGNVVALQVVTSGGCAVGDHVAVFDFEYGDYRAG